MVDGAVVTVKGLIKRYGSVTAVNGISFSVQKGEIFGLLGPNGAGKTTTLECLEGIRKPDDGRMMIDGCDPESDGRELRKRLGVQLQSSSLPDNIRTSEAMALVCAWHGLSPRIDLLRDFGLEDSLQKQYHTLS
ncbi:MAG TPA: ATP-binding cassette domain-containing protein, partial [Syntrophomonadaceae bacterium]|nr:ATP-binding cassette domain-containing protein [Syntrophomonadaceae bacterium]